MAGADKTSGRTQTGHDQDGIRRRLDTLGERLAEIQSRHAPTPPPDAGARGAAFGQAMRLGVELVAGVCVGGFIGWALDRFFGTAPFLILGPPFEPVLRGIGVLIVFWLILYWMYRRKIFLRI